MKPVRPLLSLLVLGPLLLVADPAAGTPPRERPETPPLSLGRESAAAPVVWQEGESSQFVAQPGRIWRVVTETARTGWATSGDQKREIRQTRLRLDERRDGRYTPIAWAQHVANTEVLLLAPGDPRLIDPGPALADSLRPWPNLCSVTRYETDRALDLNLNNRMELPVRFYATVPEPATGLLLIEPDSLGRPRIVPLPEIVGGIRFEEGVLTAILWEPRSRDPDLEARFGPLYRCRFLSRLGIHGATECENCCEIPVRLHRRSQGTFWPIYERSVHHGLLDRLKNDLLLVQTGSSDPMSSEDQAALGRAAAFFYLTGNGRETQSQLLKALGPRADQPGVQILLRRLEDFFLGPRTAPADSTAKAPAPAHR